jgi:hypothetical protein
MKIKVGCIRYPVAFVKGLKSSDGHRMDGLSNASDKYIKVCLDIPKDIQRLTLLHEVVHMLFIHAGKKVSEETVEALSYELLGLLQENPELITYLTNKEEN